MLAGNDRHAPNLNAVIVGKTSSGAKGTSWAVARALMAHVCPEVMESRVLGGFGSGESLVDAVRDPSGDDDATAPRDKRLLIYEPEFTHPLKVIGRDGSTLGPIVRHAWDGHRLEARSRANLAVANDAHVAVLAHVTPEELRARLSDVETYGGTANRFLFVLSRRSQRLPAGGNVPDEVAKRYGCQLGEALRQARSRSEMKRTPEAAAGWEEVYDELCDDEPGGLVGAAIGRAAPTVLRLSLVYALADGANAIDVEHVEAARAVWRYCRASAGWLFGDRLGDNVADRLLDAIRNAGAAGLTATEQSANLGRHVKADRIDEARRRLEAAGLISTTTEDTGGRPKVISRAKEHPS